MSKTTPVSVRFEQHERAALEAEARLGRRSLSDQVRVYVRMGRQSLSDEVRVYVVERLARDGLLSGNSQAEPAKKLTYYEYGMMARTLGRPLDPAGLDEYQSFEYRRGYFGYDK